MEVVINKCYGGFSLSAQAVAELAKRKGRPVYFFTQDIVRGGLQATYKSVSVEQASKDFMFSAFDIPNPNEVLKSDKDWKDMSMEERRANSDLYQQHSIDNRPNDRSDPDLAAVVKILGPVANGRCSELKVVEIPDGVEYTVEEYDGLEHVAEAHRTWY